MLTTLGTASCVVEWKIEKSQRFWLCSEMLWWTAQNSNYSKKNVFSMRILLEKLNHSVKVSSEGNEMRFWSQMDSYMTDDVLFYSFKSIKIHDILTIDEYDKHCLVILDKHSELPVLVQLSGSSGHRKAGWGIAWDQGRKEEISWEKGYKDLCLEYFGSFSTQKHIENENQQ